jgi:hypothetical protein
MKKFSIITVMLAVTAFASPAFTAGYGTAGCGFGGMVIKDNRILPQIGAWFLNSLLGNQTFGITSGTSECGSKKAVLADQDQQLFVENNYQNLAKEMAVGEGENLSTLAGLLGCPADEPAAFAAFTKKNYTSIFKGEDTTPAEMLTALKKGLSGHPVFASSCHRI